MAPEEAWRREIEKPVLVLIDEAAPFEAAAEILSADAQGRLQTFGLAIVLQEIVKQIYGANPIAQAAPAMFSDAPPPE